MFSLALSCSSIAVSVAALVVSVRAHRLAKDAKDVAEHAETRAIYAIESERKHVGLPYDHKIVRLFENREYMRLPGYLHGIRDVDHDGVTSSDDAIEVFSDGTYRIVSRKEVFSVLKPVFCRVHGTCDDPSCPYAISAVVPRVRTSMVLLPRSGTVYIDTGACELERIPNALQVLVSSCRPSDCTSDPQGV